MGEIKHRIQKHKKLFKNLTRLYKKQLNKINIIEPLTKGIFRFYRTSLKFQFRLLTIIALVITLLVPENQVVAYDKNKEIISGDKAKLIQTVASISTYTPIVGSIKADLPVTKPEIFIEKPEIIQTKTRAEIEDEKKKEEQKKLLVTNRIVVPRDSQSTVIETDNNPFQSQTSYTNSYSYGFCTWYAASRRPDVPGNWGNAGSWFISAQNSGRETGSEPKIGAIIVTYESWVGHVGYVENVEGDKVTISEMNFIGWGMINYRTMDKNSSVIHGYIY